uniref:NADH dehydrogenase subunit 5 n=1 Tax=Jogocerus viraktamathi TaxID=3111112 RepID=UPI002E7A3222|nr:NADH dehydrogenase subunit 5 [Jogocerus viraktamathi]WRK19233.1 NADH dehydrogenase subunit 5 [Jogocerus viraktamathi]
MVKLNYYLCWFFVLLSVFFFFFFFSFFLGYMDINYFIEFNLISVSSVNFSYVMYFDWISTSFISVVLLISCMVIIYSIQYMGVMSYSSDRFLMLVLLFIFSMFLMIISPNLVSIILGWDGLGLTSYCLVIYYNSMKSYLAGLITFLTNRLGDIGLLISICWLISYGSWHFIFYSSYNGFIYYLISVSCFTSSAQVPFSCWLPAAMAAPTPVSALVHSSTLVTAGVYLLIRFSNYFVKNNFLLLISLITMLLASICSLFEFDLKSIIALSTLSQLGLMMSSLFLNLLDLCYFHLITHAMFKSLLFLCAGIYIFYMNDNQDIRMMNYVCNNMPITTACFNISNLSLCGIPFLSGFYSSDLIIEYSLFFNINMFVLMIFYVSLGLTVGYSLRLFYYTMMYNNNCMSLGLMVDKFDYMSFSILILSFFSIFIGCLFIWLMNMDFMFMLLPFYMKIMTFMFMFFGMWISYEIHFFGYLFFKNYYYFNNYLWCIYSHVFYAHKMFYYFSFKSSEVLVSWGEYYGPSGLSMMLISFSSFFQFYFMSSLSIFMLIFFLWFMIFS